MLNCRMPSAIVEIGYEKDAPYTNFIDVDDSFCQRKPMSRR